MQITATIRRATGQLIQETRVGNAARRNRYPRRTFWAPYERFFAHPVVEDRGLCKNTFQDTEDDEQRGEQRNFEKKKEGRKRGSCQGLEMWYCS